MSTVTTKTFDLMALFVKNVAKYGGVLTSDADGSMRKRKIEKVYGGSEKPFSKKKKTKQMVQNRIKQNYQNDRTRTNSAFNNDRKALKYNSHSLNLKDDYPDIETEATENFDCDEDGEKQLIQKLIKPEIKCNESKTKEYSDDISNPQICMTKVKEEPTDVKIEYTEYKKEVTDDVSSFPKLDSAHGEMFVDIKSEDYSENAVTKSMIMQLLRKSVAKVESMSCDKYVFSKKNSKQESLISNIVPNDRNGKSTLTKKAISGEGGPSVPGIRKKIRKRKCTKVMQFTEEEDKTILDSIKKHGENINIVKLANQLGRAGNSVRTRIRKLKKGERSRKPHVPFSLEEDLTIMDKVLPHLDGKLLKNLVFHFDDDIIKELAVSLVRDERSVLKRWTNILQAWILQFHTGTLNLDIRRMLINYLADTFQSKDDIDWPLVAERPEFVGHTVRSLRYTFFNIVPMVRKFKDETISTYQELTLKQIAKDAIEYFTLKQCPKTSQRTLTRQNQVIEYFEQYRKKYGITNFL